MKLTLFSLLLAFALTRSIQADDTATASPKAEPEKITTAYLTFPTVSLPNAGLMFSISRQENGFSVTIDASEQFLKHNKISARVHYPSDGNHPPAPGSPGGVGLAGSFGGSWSWYTDFPFGKNFFQEAWLQVSIGSRQIWLEIPYGCFTRDPHAPPPPSSSESEARYAPAMKNLLHAKTTAHLWPVDPFNSSDRTLQARDIILHWTSIHYDSFPIQNGWRLIFIRWNYREEPPNEVQLYREQGHWDLLTPSTALRLNEDGANISSGTRMAIRLHNDGMYRSDTFGSLDRHNDDERRRMGKVEFDVDGKLYYLIVPSSIYKFHHGTTTADAKCW